MTCNPLPLKEKSRFPGLAALLLFLSALVRIVYYVTQWSTGISDFELLTQGVLPVAACLLFCTFLLSTDQTHLSWTILPTWLGCAFFVFRSLSFEGWHMALCCVLYAAVGVIYTLTALGILRTNLFLFLVTATPFCFHLGLDAGQIGANWSEINWISWLPELSVLLIMAGLALLSMALVPDGASPAATPKTDEEYQPLFEQPEETADESDEEAEESEETAEPEESEETEKAGETVAE